MKQKHDTKTETMNKKGRFSDEDNKVVYLSYGNLSNAGDRFQTRSWVKIESSGSIIGVIPVPAMKIPESLELHKMFDYACVHYASKVYFISGYYMTPKPDDWGVYDPMKVSTKVFTHEVLVWDEYVHDHPMIPTPIIDDDGLPFSNKVFTYDLNSQSWDDYDPMMNLNVPRSTPLASLIPDHHCIYVFGGKMVSIKRDKPTWIEWYDLQDPTSGWQFVANEKSYPPDNLFDHADYSTLCHVVDQRRNRVLIYANDGYGLEQLFSFDYVEKTWYGVPFKVGGGRNCTQLAIEQDLLIGQSSETIWGYNMSTNTFDLQYTVEDLAPHFDRVGIYGNFYFPTNWFLLRVAKNKLLVLWGMYPTDTLFCRQFRITENSSKDPSSWSKDASRYDLDPDGSEDYPIPGRGLETCFLV